MAVVIRTVAAVVIPSCAEDFQASSDCPFGSRVSAGFTEQGSCRFPRYLCATTRPERKGAVALKHPASALRKGTGGAWPTPAGAPGYTMRGVGIPEGPAKGRGGE